MGHSWQRPQETSNLKKLNLVFCQSTCATNHQNLWTMASKQTSQSCTSSTFFAPALYFSDLLLCFLCALLTIYLIYSKTNTAVQHVFSHTLFKVIGLRQQCETALHSHPHLNKSTVLRVNA